MIRILFALFVVCFAACGAEFEDLLKQTGEAMQAGRTNQALTLATQAIDMQPTNAQAWFLRGRLHAHMQNHTNALADFDRAAKLDPRPIVFQQRGTEHFRAGNFDKSVADFDKFIELAPTQAAHHWQRGISLYYAGRFEDGAKQFELHRTVNPNDVENAVWHFLCVARMHGMDEARKKLIPISGDSRVPMAEVHDLFSGKGTKEDVLEAGEKGDGPGMKNSLFYAHLYLGLFEEARGNDAASLEHIRKAAHEFSQAHYMGDVARVHLKLRAGDKEKPATEAAAGSK